MRLLANAPPCAANIYKKVQFTQWYIQKSTADTISNPAQLKESSWELTQVPGTVAAHCFTTKQDAASIEDFDWWYRTDLEHQGDPAEVEIIFEGLATLSEVWVNNQLIAKHSSMFVPLLIKALVKPGINTLHLSFRSLTKALNQRRPRPSWKTPLIDQQQLRWFRTSLLGRMYGWTQPWPMVGPWRDITGYQKSAVFLRQKYLCTDLKDNNGRVTGHLLIESAHAVENAFLIIGESQFALVFNQVDIDQYAAEINICINDAPLWWPHTHGTPTLFDAALILDASDRNYKFELGAIGFKHLALTRDAKKLEFIINGQSIFARGATWTTDNIVSLSTSEQSLRQQLIIARDAGVNMLRINGTMVYETDTFFNLCDELGILVWQDFMFANMDYPTQDPDFSALVCNEVQHHIIRNAAHCCMTAYCGSNEIQMQAAMVGLPASAYANEFFDQQLPEFIASLHPSIPYFVSSPCDGELPFLPQTGTSHYYGIGAFRQPLVDAEVSQVKFATECLAFSNVPENKNLELLFDGKMPYTHSPIWKQSVPRMAATGYDFEDVRDYYLKELYGIDAMTLRAFDTSRYLNYSRIVMAEVIAQTLALWRSSFTLCRGALMFFWRDFYLGAGWGLIDSLGIPKSTYYAWKRACQPIAVFLINRGLNGVAAEIINETAQNYSFTVKLQGYTELDAQSIAVTQTLEVAARSQQTIMVDTLIGYFTDLPHSFRFGPIQHKVIHIQLIDSETGTTLSEDFFFPKREFLPQHAHKGLEIQTQKLSEGSYTIHIQSPSFLQWVKLDLPNFQLSNNYFHLAPNTPVSILANALNNSESHELKGYLEAINLQEAVRIRC